MKNFIALLAFAVLVLFNSCTKEALVEPETEAIETEQLLPYPTATNTQPIGRAGERSTILQISVTKVSVSQSSGVLSVNMSCGYNLTGVTLENGQNLRFLDGNGNEVVLPFTVNNYLGSNGALSAGFSIGGNNLTGLELKSMQDIIIQDDILN